MSYLNQINEPADLKKLTIEELNTLAAEVRSALLQKLSSSGGHIGPNLGMVETTIALHYVFDSPHDKIVFDVSHQSYVHKMLTGRKEAFLNSACYKSVSGFTDPQESVHDQFKVGHTATSISLACGLAKARDLQHAAGNVIAVIGDGSLSGGEAYEGLNNAAVSGHNIIIIINDNEMSIVPNQGGLYANLALLRASGGEAEPNFFKALGFEYRYVRDGHDLPALIAAFRAVKDLDQPIVVHLHTIKGKGFLPAETDPEAWHAGGPFDITTGERRRTDKPAETYEMITAEYLLQQLKQDPRIVAITAATPSVAGFTKAFREAAGRQYVDVGIAEEHAVAFASGIAANGGKPVLGIFSSFIQRTYDQLSQDLCLNSNPALILVFGGGLDGKRDATHLGSFDISLLSNIPNLVYLAPTSKQEYLDMLAWGLKQRQHPAAIRVPYAPVIEDFHYQPFDFDELNTYRQLVKGTRVALIGAGDYSVLAQETLDRLKAQAAINGTLINPRYLTGLDDKLLEELRHDHQLAVTLESGILDGGFGAKIARYYAGTAMRVLTFGGQKEFTDRIGQPELIARYHLSPELIVQDIVKTLVES